MTYLAAFALLLPLLALRRESLMKLYGMRGLALVCFVTTLFLTLSGCAEGGNFNTIPPSVETVTITCTAAGGATVTTDLTLNVTR